MGVRAFRTWNLGSKGIRSGLDPDRWDNPTWWQPGTNVATCKFHADHNAPEQSCRCGWRGNPDYDNLLWWLECFKRVDASIIGVVELSGSILQGDHAHPEIPGILRAEKAEIVGPLVVNPLFGTVATYLARKYRVKVHIATSCAPLEWMSKVDRSLFE